MTAAELFDLTGRVALVTLVVLMQFTLDLRVLAAADVIVDKNALFARSSLESPTQ